MDKLHSDDLSDARIAGCSASLENVTHMIDANNMDEVKELLRNLNALIRFICKTKSTYLFSYDFAPSLDRIQPTLEIKADKFVTDILGHYDYHESLQAAVDHLETFFVDMMTKLEGSYIDLVPLKRYNYYLSTGEIPLNGEENE